MDVDGWIYSIIGDRSLIALAMLPSMRPCFLSNCPLDDVSFDGSNLLLLLMMMHMMCVLS